MKLDEIKKAFKETQKADTLLLESASKNFDMIINESVRVAEIAHNSDKIINELDERFSKETGLNSIDVSIMLLAVSMQVARQYLLSNEKYRLTANQGDKLIKDPVKKNFPNFEKILLSSVPYDAIQTSDLFKYSTNLSGTTHRYRTLGHDPILGWIIGPANIMTSSLTRYDFDTYYVSSGIIQRKYPLGFKGMIDDFIFVSCKNPDRLVASVIKQAMHFGSDFFTKQGLPLPFISTIDNDLAKNMMIKWNLDLYSVTRGAGFSVLINYMIATIHKLFYNPSIDDEKLYEIKTRKIILYSNLIATSSNLGIVAYTKNLKKLDLGGLGVTLYRLITDIKFIQKIKREFIYGEFHNMIQGNELELLDYSYEDFSVNYK